jgi:hypothetical protein
MKLDPQMTMLILLMSTVLDASLAASASSLYECNNESGKHLYTDSPAQLDHCEPVKFGQPHNLANPSSDSLATQAEVQPAASTAAPAETSGVSQAANQGTSPATTPASTPGACPQGFNPLNPFTTATC